MVGILIRTWRIRIALVQVILCGSLRGRAVVTQSDSEGISFACFLARVVAVVSERNVE